MFDKFALIFNIYHGILNLSNTYFAKINHKVDNTQKKLKKDSITAELARDVVVHAPLSFGPIFFYGL